jgi:hypothetical protein
VGVCEGGREVRIFLGTQTKQAGAQAPAFLSAGESSEMVSALAMMRKLRGIAGEIGVYGDQSRKSKANV